VHLPMLNLKKREISIYLGVRLGQVSAPCGAARTGSLSVLLLLFIAACVRNILLSDGLTSFIESLIAS